MYGPVRPSTTPRMSPPTTAPLQIADAAQDRGDESLEQDGKAEAGVHRLDLRCVQQASDDPERAAHAEHDEDRAVDGDAHQPRGVQILRRCANAVTGLEELQIGAEQRHRDDRHDDRDDGDPGDAQPAEVEGATGQRRGERSRGRAGRRLHDAADDQRCAERRDHRDQTRRVAHRPRRRAARRAWR